jgi:hypothetical protein
VKPTTLSLVLVVMIVAGTRDARAICGEPPPIATSPHRRDLAPTNARVTMTVRRDWRQGTTFELRTAPAPGRERALVPTKVRQSNSGDYERFELVPDAPLAPGTAFEIWATRGELIGAFVTGAYADTSPPTWSGLTTGTAYKKPAPVRGRPGVITLSEECGEHFLSLRTAAVAVDDHTKDIRYAVWAAPSTQKIDYTRPPLGWTRIDEENARLASPPGKPISYTLGYGNTDFDNDIDLPTVRPLLVGVKAIDLAGNESAPSELAVK